MERANARTAVVWQVLRRELGRLTTSTPDAALRVLDVGGGTGGFAVPLARAGHHVTVVDASPDALAALTRRAAEAGVAGLILAVQGDADLLGELAEPGSADLVLCHSVLEVVDSPSDVASALATTLRPGGAASVLVANRAAAVLARAMNGQFEVAAAALTDPDGRIPERLGGAEPASRDTLLRRFDVEAATALLTKAGLAVEEVHGVRVVADLVPGGHARFPGAAQRGEEREQENLVAFELAVAGRSPYRDIATQLHLLARRA
ncbi:MAG TPA: methyltransferase domain-containing protein [Micromonosporaceae bacterium]